MFVKSIQITGKKFLSPVMMTSFEGALKKSNYRDSRLHIKRFF